jgi:sarcosine/dimethylglycine N-methyltransferase
VTDIQIETQYSTGASRQAIEQALITAGKDLGHLQPADLALLEDFHTMGRITTTQLAGLAQITPDDEVLDAGSGIGGTARYVAGRTRCRVVAVDLTEEYCATARWLNQLAGLDDRISVRQADVTDLPFQDATIPIDGGGVAVGEGVGQPGDRGRPPEVTRPGRAAAPAAKSPL